jgi:hypothetical protein
MTIMFNAQWAIGFNLMSILWKKISSNVSLCDCFFKFMKMVELVVIQIKRSVEDKRTFSKLHEHKIVKLAL